MKLILFNLKKKLSFIYKSLNIIKIQDKFPKDILNSAVLIIKSTAFLHLI